MYIQIRINQSTECSAWMDVIKRIELQIEKGQGDEVGREVVLVGFWLYSQQERSIEENKYMSIAVVILERSMADNYGNFWKALKLRNLQ